MGSFRLGISSGLEPDSRLSRAHAAEERVEYEGAMAEKFKLLLVDDEEELVNALAERLQIRGLDPEVALSGETALQIISERPPDVMLLDLKMPGMDGLEVLRRIKKTHPRIEVVILTGHGGEKDRETALRLGAFEYLQKPADIGDLVHALSRAFRHGAS